MIKKKRQTSLASSVMRGFQICCIWILFFSTKVDFHFFWNGEKHCTLCFCLLHLQQLCKKIITVLCWSDTRYCSCSSLVFSPTHAFTLSGFVPPPDTAYTLHIFFLWWFFFLPPLCSILYLKHYEVKVNMANCDTKLHGVVIPFEAQSEAKLLGFLTFSVEVSNNYLSIIY